MKTFLRGSILILASLILLSVIHIALFMNTRTAPPKAIRMDIISGMSAWDISRQLALNNVITDAHTFMAMALVLKRARNLQAGTYVFEGRHYPLEVMDILYKGKSLRYKITIPEGYDIYKIGDVLASTGIFSRDEFIKSALKSDTAKFFSVDAPSMEGFLFPDTYFLALHMTPLEIIARMFRRFNVIYTPEMRQRAKILGLTDREVLTLASLIEKEAIAAQEKPIIASVFYNRLRLGMRLQSDPTAIYGLKDFHRDIAPEDLKRPSPYNTYLVDGLPPGPICNPSKGSITAVLWPAQTKHLYFVSKGDGHHFFSTCYKDHASAIQKSNQLRKKNEH